MYITGIIGYPLKTTFSPCLHNAVFNKLGIDGVYLRLPVQHEQLKNAIAGLRALGFRGVNITIPYKESVVELIDELKDEAAQINTVNTILVENERLIGYNTDVYGFKKSLEEYRVIVKDKNVLLMGVGGAGQACAHVIHSLQPKHFYVTNRTPARSTQCSQLYNAEHIPIENIVTVIPKADVIINATSVNIQQSVVPLMEKGTVFFDINYKFRMLKRRGVKVIHGLLMLLLQGAKSFQLWTGRDMPLDEMKTEVGLKNG